MRRYEYEASVCSECAHHRYPKKKAVFVLLGIYTIVFAIEFALLQLGLIFFNFKGSGGEMPAERAGHAVIEEL